MPVLTVAVRQSVMGMNPPSVHGIMLTACSIRAMFTANVRELNVIPVVSSKLQHLLNSRTAATPCYSKDMLLTLCMLWSGADLYYCFALRGSSLNFPICMLHISTNQQLFDNQHSPLYLNRHMKKAPSCLHFCSSRKDASLDLPFTCYPRAIPHNSSAALAMPFLPSASCRNLDLPPVNLRFLQSHLTKNAFAIAPTHLCGIALGLYSTFRSTRSLGETSR